MIGTSTGGVEALSRVVRSLPTGFPASLFVVCHVPSGSRSVLPEILSREGHLLASHAIDGERFYPGHIYVAPPDQHLLLGPEGRVRLTRGARENHHRPAVDPLFRSAARYYGPRVVGVVLTGAMHDGTAGMLAIRGAGGLGIVQDPADAVIASMPQSAGLIAGADHVVALSELVPLLIQLVQDNEISIRGGPDVDGINRMKGIVDQDMERQAHDQLEGSRTVFSCPECGGALWQVVESRPLQFRCHVGHVYNGEVLLSEQSEALEAALWTAVRTFREKSVLGRQLAARERSQGLAGSAERFEEQANLAARYGGLIQRFLLENPPPDPGFAENPPVPDGHT